MRRDIVSTSVLHGTAAAVFFIGFKKNKPALYGLGFALVATGIAVSRRGRKAAGTLN